MTTSVKFLLQMVKSNSTYNGLHEKDLITEVYESWLFCSLDGVDRSRKQKLRLLGCFCRSMVELHVESRFSLFYTLQPPCIKQFLVGFDTFK